MKSFIYVALFLFVALLGFNIFQLDYKIDFLSEENKMFTYSSMFAVIGLLITLILLVLRKIALKES